MRDDGAAGFAREMRFYQAEEGFTLPLALGRR